MAKAKARSVMDYFPPEALASGQPLFPYLPQGTRPEVHDDSCPYWPNHETGGFACNCHRDKLFLPADTGLAPIFLTHDGLISPRPHYKVLPLLVGTPYEAALKRQQQRRARREG